MPNLFADIALLAWPLFAFILFRSLNTIPAVFWTITGGYLLLPVKVNFDLPFIPPLDKESIAALSALLLTVMVKKINIPIVPQDGKLKIIFILILLIPLINVFTNQTPMFNEKVWIPGLSLHDGISEMLALYIKLITFILGMQLVRTFDDQLMLLKLLLIAGLAYSVPILFEVKMSPTLHTWVYGFFPRSFLQQIRFGGFRPVVFIGHGILVAAFISVVFSAAIILYKAKYNPFKVPTKFIILYLAFILIICKTVGAIILAVIVAFALLVIPISLIKRVTGLLMILIMAYPLLSLSDLIPTTEIVEFIGSFNEERAQSIDFRFENEIRLLEHVREKLFFGWGGWGRGRLANSTTDGYWIILMGSYGLIGFLLIFGLVFLSIKKALAASDYLTCSKERVVMLGHAFTVVIFMLDQIPNHSLFSWLWFYIGALLGRAVYLKKLNRN